MMSMLIFRGVIIKVEKWSTRISRRSKDRKYLKRTWCVCVLPVACVRVCVGGGGGVGSMGFNLHIFARITHDILSFMFIVLNNSIDDLLR